MQQGLLDALIHLRKEIRVDCMELPPTQVNSRCAVDRRSQRAAWCRSLHINASVFDSDGLMNTLKIMVGYKCTYADMSTKHVHTLTTASKTSEIAYVQTATYEMSALTVYFCNLDY